MIALSDEQDAAVRQPGNIVVTACPGSGKTRVLTARVIKGVQDLKSSKHRVIALTFTNRASAEIRARIDQLSIDQSRLWAGTIHAFALDWILRPYAPYHPRLRKGFAVADEFHCEKTLKELKIIHGLTRNDSISCIRNRDGEVKNASEGANTAYLAYQARLVQDKLLDYDDLLYVAYRLLIDFPEIAQTLANIFRLICVDEIQDVQDLQYGILSAIYKGSPDPPTIFFVGDPDQSIYESIGAMTKTPDEIVEEFGLRDLNSMVLTGNYRSTQRIIDFYQHLRPGPRIESLTEFSMDHGRITFQNQTVTKNDLPTFISHLIRDSVDSGVLPNDVCVLAPHWWHLHALGRTLVGLMPDIDFDAPGLSPLHFQRETIWFKIARLFLTLPSPRIYQARFRWAGEIILELQDLHSIVLAEAYATPRGLLRLLNSIESPSQDGLNFLDDVFNITMLGLGIDLNANDALKISHALFFEKARDRIQSLGTNMPTDVQTFRKLFKHPSGVVINTCHGVKGEEYDTVIAYGLLRGYVPHWDVIINGGARAANDRESKLLYVICSRAKRRLHLIAESGRSTQRGTPLVTATLLTSFDFAFD